MDSPESLSGLRDAWSRRLLALGDDATAIESSFRDAQAVVRLHASRLNDLNPIVSLPMDVLEDIFLAARNGSEYLVGYPPPGITSMRHQIEWVVVSQICRRWRQVALASTRLWTVIDTSVYTIPFCQQMLLRLGSRQFTLSASAKGDMGLLSCYDLRERASRQLLELTVSFDDSVLLPGSVLDMIFSHEPSLSSPVLRSLTLNCRTPKNLPWASLNRVLPNLETLHLVLLYPTHMAPSILPRLRTMSLNAVILTASDVAPGILDILKVMPVIESLTFINCIFSAPENQLSVTLPTSLRSLEFNAYGELHLQSVLALSGVLEQSAGDRKFYINQIPGALVVPTTDLFSKVKRIVETGRAVREVVLEFVAPGSLDVSVEFEACTTLQTSHPFRVHFYHTLPQLWANFCSSMDGIDMRDAILRIISDKATPMMYSTTFNVFVELQRLSVSAVHITGSLSCASVVCFFIGLLMMNQGGSMGSSDTSLGFMNVRDLVIGPRNFAHQSTSTIYEHCHLFPVEQCLNEIDESALHLLSYARVRRNRAMKPLRTVALPTELLHRIWIEELNELIEGDAISYDAYMNPQDDAEASSCRAMVLYRPLLRVIDFWETRTLWVFTPMIGMLGVLWTRSRR